MSDVNKGSSAGAADIYLLFTGYVGERTASTVGFVVDGDVKVVIDPGMVPETRAILDPLAELGYSPGDVTDVVLSHHHPDHASVARHAFGETCGLVSAKRRYGRVLRVCASVRAHGGRVGCTGPGLDAVACS